MLVENGFERLEAEQLVQKSKRQRTSEAPLFNQPGDEEEEASQPSVDIEVNDPPNLNTLPESTRKKVRADPSTGTVTYLERLVQGYLIEENGFSLDALVRDKYRLRRAVEARIDEHRNAAHHEHYETLLWGGDGAPAVTVDPEICFAFGPDYPYTALYDGEFEYVHHYYGPKQVGRMNREEAECAFFLDHQPEIEHWVRNLDQNQKYGFCLQTSSGKFFPDFVCKLADGRFLVVEYKGEHLRGGPDATEKENVGEVWAKRSEGRCLFTMVGNDDYEEQIRSLLS